MVLFEPNHKSIGGFEQKMKYTEREYEQAQALMDGDFGTYKRLNKALNVLYEKYLVLFDKQQDMETKYEYLGRLKMLNELIYWTGDRYSLKEYLVSLNISEYDLLEQIILHNRNFDKEVTKSWKDEEGKIKTWN